MDVAEFEWLKWARGLTRLFAGFFEERKFE
jgi:hypothetical protein